MTILEAKRLMQKINMTLRRISETNEFRVNFYAGLEETAYYTNDLEDAVQTAKLMHKRRLDELNPLDK